MSAYQQGQIGNGFPFGTSLLQHITLPGATPAQDARLRHANVTSAAIPQGHARQSAGPALSSAGYRAQDSSAERKVTAPFRSPARLRQATSRPAGLRLFQLRDVLQGGNGRAASPRTRTDHMLIWVTAGSVRLSFPRQHHDLRAGELRLIVAGTAFTILPMPDAAGHVALIAPQMAAAAIPRLPDAGLTASVGGHGTQILAVLSDLAAESADPNSATTGCLLNLLSLRLRQLDRLRPVEAGDPQAQTGHALLDGFLELAGRRLGQNGSLGDLADELGTTVAALDRACLAARGRRAVEMLHELRLERAVVLLRHSQRSPSRIASDLGYSSHAHFTRAFVAATGRTPEMFRAQPCRS